MLGLHGTSWTLQVPVAFPVSSSCLLIIFLILANQTRKPVFDVILDVTGQDGRSRGKSVLNSVEQFYRMLQHIISLRYWTDKRFVYLISTFFICLQNSGLPFPQVIKGTMSRGDKGCRRNLCSNSFFCSLTTFKGNFVKVGHRTVTGKENLVEYFREVQTNNLKNICESCYLRVVCDGFILATGRQKTAGVRAEWSDSVLIWPYLGNWAASAFVKRRPALSLNHPDICYWKRSIRGSCVLFAESRESKTPRRQRQWQYHKSETCLVEWEKIIVLHAFWCFLT